MCTHTGVLNLRNTATSNTAIIITWDPADSPDDCGPILYYTVTTTSLADARDRNTIVWGPRAEFSDLINGTEYTISVAAINRAGSGPSSTMNVTGNAIGK